MPYALPSQGIRLLTCRQARASVIAAWLLALMGSNQPVAAQLTMQNVIGDSVEVIGPKYADIDSAITEFRGRNLKAAREFLGAAYKKESSLPPVNVMLARMELLVGRPESARRLLESVAAQEPEDPEPYLFFAEEALAAGRTTAAELLLSSADVKTGALGKNAYRKQRLKSRAQAGLAAIAEQREDWALAIVHVEAWLQADPENAAAHQRMGRAQLMLKRVKPAYESFAKARDLDSSLPIADVAMAQLFEQQGRTDDAERFIYRALRTFPDDLPTLLAASRWLLGDQQAKDALPHLEGAIKANPDSVEAHFLAGVTSRLVGRDETAKKIFDRAHLLAPTDFDVNNQLALLLIDGTARDDQQRALQFAQLNAQLHPDNTEAGLTLSWIYYRLGRRADSEQVLAASLKAGTRSADASYFVAKMFYDRGRDAAAADLLRESLAARAMFVHREQAQQLLDRIEGRSR